MKKTIQHLFGGIRLTWPKLILFAVIAGAFTAAMAIIPAFQHTSFNAITVTFEVWVLFGILIIMNSKSNLDAALKCFVFFLISQPLVYLLQVPFSTLGWSLFVYYPYWFMWTVLCLPMGFVGYYMKKGKWWGYLILLPMIGLTALSYSTYVSLFQFYLPRYLLICLFCACGMIFYPVFIFADRRIRTVGAVIGLAAVAIITVICLLDPPVYSTDIMGSNEEHPFDDSCMVSLADGKLGSVEIAYLPEIEEYVVHAEFRRAGKTVLTLETSGGETREYDLTVERDTYELTPRSP